MLRSTTLAALLLGTVSLVAQTVIDDAELISTLQREVEKYANQDEGPSCEDLFKAIGDAPQKIDLKIPEVEVQGTPDKSVYLISSVNLCGKCDKWHPSGTASAWALSSDGVMVTNHHVFENAKDGAMGVCGIDGNTHRVIEVLAADAANDIAIFRVDSKKLIPLPIGESAPVGAKVEVVSHPDKRLFTHTFGHVSRYHKKPRKPGDQGHVQMSITADYAKGSSGGPVLNEKGEVVGMVSSTHSIYYKSSGGQTPKGPLQMVIKNCVPVSAITAMLSKEDGVSAE